MSVQGYCKQNENGHQIIDQALTVRHKVLGYFIPHEEKKASLNCIVQTEINFIPDKRIEQRVAPADPRVSRVTGHGSDTRSDAIRYDTRWRFIGAERPGHASSLLSSPELRALQQTVRFSCDPVTCVISSAVPYHSLPLVRSFNRDTNLQE